MPGADLVQRRALPHRHEPVEVPERGRAREELDPGLAGALDERPSLLVTALPQQPAAELRALVDEHDIGAELGRRRRGRESRDTAADHEQVGVAAPVLGPPRPLGLLLRQLAEPGRVAQHLLVERPQPARADERLVVEAGRRERSAERVGDRHEVVLEAGARVQMLDRRTVAHGFGAGAHAWGAVDGDEAVRAVAGAAHQPAPAVVLEAARERPLAGGVQRRADRVALERGDLLAVEVERDRLVAVDQLRGLGRQAGHALGPPCSSSPGRPTRSTSFVRVSRSA